MDRAEVHGQVQAKFANESTTRTAEHVEIFPSGLMMIEWANEEARTWYPPDKAPVIKAT